MAAIKEQKVGIASAKGADPRWIETRSKRHLQAKPAAAKEPEAKVRPATVINKLNHNATLSYNGLAMVVAPQARAEIADYEKLGALPRGVICVPKAKK